MSFEERIIITLILFIKVGYIMLIPCSKPSFFRILDGCIKVLLQMIIDEYDRVILFINWNIFKMFTLSKIVMFNFWFGW